jgi:hypothetical protein
MALTEKIALEITNLARADSLAKVKVYAPANQGNMLYTRLSKVMPLPVRYQGSKITTYLRMLYTSARYFIDVHGDK